MQRYRCAVEILVSSKHNVYDIRQDRNPGVSYRPIKVLVLCYSGLENV